MKKFLLALMCLTLLPTSPSHAKDESWKSHPVVPILVGGTVLVAALIYVNYHRTNNPENNLPTHSHEKKRKKPKLIKHTEDTNEPRAEEKQETILSQPTANVDIAKEPDAPLTSTTTSEPKKLTPIIENKKPSTHTSATEEGPIYFDRLNHYWE